MPRRFQPVVPAGTMRDLGQPTIEAHGLVLRPWEDGDVPAAHAAYDDPDIRYWHAREFATDDEALAWIREFHARWEAETDGTWAIVATDGAHLGQIALRMITLEFGQAMISYWTLPEARDRGIASSALDALATWAFDDLGLHRLVVEHSVDNPASCRVATKAGFEAEGILRQAVLHEDGWHDMHVHGRVQAQGPSLPNKTNRRS